MSETEKALLRVRFLSWRQSLSKKTVRGKGGKIAGKLFALKEFKKTPLLASFVDFENEPPTRKIIQKAWGLKKTVVVPRMDKEKTALSFHAIKSLNELLPNYQGILEPPLQNPVVEPAEIPLLLVPGLAFDENGHRLGFGGGYFDRFLPKVAQAFKIGLCFEKSMAPELPKENHDIPMDMVITEKKARRFG